MRWYPGVHYKERGQQGKGGDPPPLLCPGWNTVFSSELGSPRKAVNFYESPEEGHKDGEGPGVSQDRVRNLGLLGLEKTMREILPMLLNI